MKNKIHNGCTIKNILIVDDCHRDQQLVANLFKRNLHEKATSLTIACASSLSEAKKHLSIQQFHVITLDGCMGLEFGYHLIPSIAEFQTQAPTIIMISGHNDSIKKGIAAGAHFGFSKTELTNDVMLNDTFQLVPSRSVIK